jgi:hypothetical protein
VRAYGCGVTPARRLNICGSAVASTAWLPEILDVVRDVVPDQAHAFEGRGTSPRGKLGLP